MASKKPSKTFAGGCLCGAIRYESTAEANFAIHCYCRQCQRLTGSGHASQFAVPMAGVSITGKLSKFVLKSDSGNAVTNNFCGVCGSPVMKATSGYPEAVFFYAATLDDPARFKAQQNVWTSSAQPWDHIDPAIPTND